MGVLMSMGKKLYRVQLLPEERAEFERLLSSNKAARWNITRAQAMLKCDQGPDGPGWGDELMAQAYGVTTRSLENWRKPAVLQGPLSL
jgi:anti-sigma factor RsiW